jgi:hypothetical protein
MIVSLSSFATAFQKPAAQQAGMTLQLEISAQDVITAPDAGGGCLSTGDVILIVVINFAVIGVIAVFA